MKRGKSLVRRIRDEFYRRLLDGEYEVDTRLCYKLLSEDVKIVFYADNRCQCIMYAIEYLLNKGWSIEREIASWMHEPKNETEEVYVYNVIFTLFDKFYDCNFDTSYIEMVD